MQIRQLCIKSHSLMQQRLQEPIMDLISDSYHSCSIAWHVCFIDAEQAITLFVLIVFVLLFFLIYNLLTQIVGNRILDLAIQASYRSIEEKGEDRVNDCIAIVAFGEVV